MDNVTSMHQDAGKICFSKLKVSFMLEKSSKNCILTLNNDSSSKW